MKKSLVIDQYSINRQEHCLNLASHRIKRKFWDMNSYTETIEDIITQCVTEDILYYQTNNLPIPFKAK